MHVVPVRDVDTKMSFGLWNSGEREERWREDSQQHLLQYSMLTWHLVVFKVFSYSVSLEYKFHELRDFLLSLFLGCVINIEKVSGTQ